jgi:hypothetical protein
VLLQYPNDLLFGKSVALHLWSFSMGQSLLQSGLTPSGNVTEDAIAKVYAWNERKKRFSPRQIGIALQNLQNKGWLASA